MLRTCCAKERKRNDGEGGYELLSFRRRQTSVAAFAIAPAPEFLDPSSSISSGLRVESRLSLRFISDVYESRYQSATAKAMVRPAKIVFLFVAILLACFLFASMHDPGMKVHGRAMFFLLLIACLVLSAALNYSKRARACTAQLSCVTILLSALAALFMGIFPLEVNHLKLGNDAALSGNCSITPKRPDSCVNLFGFFVLLSHAWLCVGLLLPTLFIGLSFRHSAVACAVPIMVRSVGFWVYSVAHGGVLSESIGAIQFVYVGIAVPITLFLAICAPYRVERTRRSAFAEAMRVDFLLAEKKKVISEKSRTIRSQSIELRRQSTEIEKIKEKYLPSTEEERLFAPFRERLSKSIKGHFLHGQFDEVRLLGTGAFGEVHLCTWHTRTLSKPKEVACKSLHPHLLRTPRELECVAAEIEILARIDHQNIVRFHGLFWPQGSFPLLVMELVPNGTVKTLLYGEAPLESANACECTWADPLLKVSLDLCKGLQYLHGEGIMHRDIKPANLLLTKTFGVKIGDLGTARDVANETMTLVGTPLYSAPECMMVGSRYDFSADIYSLGIILNEFDVHRRPYSTTGFSTAKVLGGRRPETRTTNAALLQLIESCWHAEPAERPSIGEVLSRLIEHGDAFGTP